MVTDFFLTMTNFVHVKCVKKFVTFNTNCQKSSFRRYLKSRQGFDRSSKNREN